jgi:hypothetical protein
MMTAQNKYVPPNRRSKQNKKKSSKAAEVNVQSISEFPELGVMKSKEVISNQNKMSYAGITREEESIEQDNENKVSPGWVKLSYEQGTKIIKEYGAQPKQLPQEEPIKCGLTETQSKELKDMVDRWQKYRDVMNDYLDQNSPYWGMKHVDDPLSEDDLESESGSECSNDDEYIDEMNDMDYDDDY